MKYIIKFRELWNNKRYRAILILGLYFVFFLSIFLLLTPNNKVQEPLHGLDLLKGVTNYQYHVTGKYEFLVRVNNGVVITYLGEEYSLENIPLELQDFDFNLNFYDIILSSTLESTNYIENKNTYLYNNYKLDVYLSGEDITKVIMYEEEYTIELEVEYD